MPEAIQHEIRVSEFRLAPRQALAGKQPLIRRGVNLEPLSIGHVLHVLGRGTDGGIVEFIRDVVHGGPFAVRAVSPGQAFIVGDDILPHADVQALARKLGPRADIVDQSHGRVRMGLHGAKAEWVLAKGTAVDLVPQAFLVGRSAMTLIGHISAHITRTSSDCFEIIVLRSFAESLWDDLDHMSREFD